MQLHFIMKGLMNKMYLIQNQRFYIQGRPLTKQLKQEYEQN
jgi:hypothetical protein